MMVEVEETTMGTNDPGNETRIRKGGSQ